MQFLFGDHVLDLDRRELRRSSELISVAPKVFDLLVHLIRNRERVVSKDDLLEAVWGGRTVSESTMTSQINAARRVIGDSGDRQSLIRTVARIGFRFVGEVREAEVIGHRATAPATRAVADGGYAPALAIPDKPSIAVLPFQNMSGDPDQEYFTDGMVEDITTAISRMRWLFVIARNSSFVYKGRAVDVKQVGRELGVRYLLEGSVRRAASRVRVNGQLVDTATGAHLWADRFDGMLEDIFELQDRVATSVVGAITPTLEKAEIERAKRKPTESLDAYDYYLRGMASLYQWTKPSNAEALRLFYQAIEWDSEFASAHGAAAWCYVWQKTQGWSGGYKQDVAEAMRVARRAVALGKDDAVALSAGGYALAHIAGELDDGYAHIERALALNPNLAGAWLGGGWVKIWLGEPDAAIEHLERAMRLSPLDPLLFRIQGATASAHLFAGRYDQASAWAERAIRENPNHRQATRVAAASHALAGRSEEARNAMIRVLQLDPELRLSNMKDRLPALRRPEDRAIYSEGLRKAGLPK